MVNHQITLSYLDFHSQDADIELEKLFKGTNQEFILGFIQILNENEKTYNSTENLINFLRNKWFSSKNNLLYKKIEYKIRSVAMMYPKTEIVIFNPPSTLLFIESLLKYLESHLNYIGERPSDLEMEKNLFEAYLIINQRINPNNTGIEKLKEEFPNEEIFWLALYKSFQYADLINRNLRELYLIEIFKGALFFELLEGNSETLKILKLFLSKYDCKNWIEYLKATTGLASMTIESAKVIANNFVEIDCNLPFYNSCKLILDNISIPLENIEIQEDYLFLRNHPIFRTAENKFQIINRRFLIEKIFRALYFEMSKIANDNKIMSRNKFRTLIYTSGYSEHCLLYNTLDRIFNSASKKLNGNEMQKADNQFGASDYLAYQNGNIFIFESKDILIKREVKQKLYIPELREEFYKKFFKDEDQEKAVLQLARNVKKLLDKDYEKFGFVFQKFRFIYPVIVVHSDAFNILGINQLLKKWFKEACYKANLTKKELYKIKPVVIIDINTLIYFQDRIGGKGLSFEQLIDSYLESTQITQFPKKQFVSVTKYQSKYLIPFSKYLDHLIKNSKPIKAPEAIRRKIKGIFLS